MVCIRGPVSIGGKCVDGESECAPVLMCIPLDTGLEGVCMQESVPGGACSSSKVQICDRFNFGNRNQGSPPLESMRGKCVNSTIGLWLDACGAGTGAKCARQDAISKFKFEREQDVCVYANNFPGQPFSFRNGGFGSKNAGFSSGRYCSAANHPPVRTDVIGDTSDYIVFKCVLYVLDGERCDYNNYVGGRNWESTCVRGVCMSS
jgi:hypothetical protein